MKRQIDVSPATFALGAGLVVAVLVIVVLATVMLTGGGDASAPPQSAPPSTTSTTPATATPSASATPTTAATETAATESPALTATPLPPTQAAAPAPAVIIVQVTPTLRPPAPPPTLVPPAATATPQSAVSPSGDYINVVSKNISGVSAASVTVDYNAIVRQGGQFYISATAWRTGTGSLWCDSTAVFAKPGLGTVTISFPWVRQAPGCSPETFSSIYACLAFDGKETVCVNVYK